MKKKSWYKSKLAWVGLIVFFLIWLFSINSSVNGFSLWMVPLGFVLGLLLNKFVFKKI